MNFYTMASPGLERSVAAEKGTSHGAPLGGWDQLGHGLAVVEVWNVANVGSDEPIGQAIHLNRNAKK